VTWRLRRHAIHVAAKHRYDHGEHGDYGDAVLTALLAGAARDRHVVGSGLHRIGLLVRLPLHRSGLPVGPGLPRDWLLVDRHDTPIKRRRQY
jgi:hypothetical protein